MFAAAFGQRDIQRARSSHRVIKEQFIETPTEQQRASG
jgi:hypothetical protein